MGWGTGNIGGGGGALLNFNVVGGTAEPAYPRDNIIWINTENKITSWFFSMTEPPTPEEGMVWIKTGTSAPASFNALKKNGIQVYPVSATQYINGAWVDKTAKTYQGGAWVDWLRFTYLFKSGSGAQVTFTHTKESQVTFTETSECVTIKAIQSTYGSMSWLTKSKVSLANAKNLVFRAKCKPFNMGTDDNFTAYFYVLTEPKTAPGFDNMASYGVARIKCEFDSEVKDYIIPVDGLAGSYYIGTTGCHEETVIYDVYYTE